MSKASLNITKGSRQSITVVEDFLRLEETEDYKHYDVAAEAEGEWGKSIVYGGATDDLPWEEEAFDDFGLEAFLEQERAAEMTASSTTKAKEAVSAAKIKSKETISKAKMSALNALSKGKVIDEEPAVEEEEEIQVEKLTYFQASMFATVLEDAITELRILMECNNPMRISKTLAEIGLLKALKYGVKQPAVTDELDGIDEDRLGCIEYKLKKLDSDRLYLAMVLMDSYKDLSLDLTYKALVGHVNDIITLNNYRIWLKEDEARNRIIRKEKLRELRQQRIHIKTVTKNNDVEIDRLNFKLEDASLDAEIRLRYVTNWENSRMEQHISTIGGKEDVFLSSIEWHKIRSENEQRVHSEVELLVNIVINETLEKIEEWMAKYEKDIEAIDLKIFVKKNEHQNMKEEREYLEDMFKKHAALIKMWKDFKEERERQREYERLMTKSAITVQAWWRGLLVRRQLGPYRPKKGKGGGKPKKK